MNVILTGFMGTGKTTVGRLLASRLGYAFLDLDELIVEREGKSINEIFSTSGESYFREVESSVLHDVLQRSFQVVSTGGGIVVLQKNRDIMKRSGIVINLTASPDTIFERLRDDVDRPLLRDSEKLRKIRKLLAEREPFYSEADIRIDTDGKNMEDVARVIMDFLESLRGVDFA